VVAAVMMKDIGFTPTRNGRPVAEMRRIASNSIEYGWRVPAVKYLMIAATFTGGVSFYIFYALQPHLLDLYGDPEAYGIAGLVAAIVAGSQILGGLVTPYVRKLFRRRTTAVFALELVAVVAVLLIGFITEFWVVLGLIVLWGLTFAASMPIRQAYLNGLIPSQQRATILSFDSLMGSSGGIVAQPVLGRAADVWGYPASYLLAGVISAASLPFIAKARAEHAPPDVVESASGQLGQATGVTPAPDDQRQP
ncbi:MAG: MFS transporter, partial [Micromonosporaceae bacterium]